MAITVQQLQARADGGQFVLDYVEGTDLVEGNMPFQPAHPEQRLVPHAAADRTAISWTAIYRTRRLSGYVLVADTSVAESYVGIVLGHAWTVFDAVDLRMNLVGVRQNGVLGPTGQPNPSTGFQGS